MCIRDRLRGVDASDTSVEGRRDEPSRGIAAHAVRAKSEIDGRRSGSVWRMWNVIHDVLSESCARNLRNEKGPLRKLRAGLANREFSSLRVGDRPFTTSTSFTGPGRSLGAGASAHGGARIEDDEGTHRSVKPVPVWKKVKAARERRTSTRSPTESFGPGHATDPDAVGHRQCEADERLP